MAQALAEPTMRIALVRDDRRTLAGGPAKRAVDLSLGLVLAVLLTPLMLLLALASAAVLRAWPFFGQLRPGHDGGTFRIWKIRTLPTSTPHYALKHDLVQPVPRLMRFLRGAHLDELPQLWLVVTGKMSLVGPRPRQDSAVETLDAAFDARRRSLPQGCTGLWQISEAQHGVFTDCPEYDDLYVGIHSVRLDLWILLQTALVMSGLRKPVALDSLPAWTTASRQAARLTLVTEPAAADSLPAAA